MASSTGARDLEQIVRDGLSTLVFGFGYKVGIVDHFIKIKQPCTAEELSQQAGMKIRYIQEWLGCLAAAGIVQVHDDGRYSLPYEEKVLREQGRNASALPILCEAMPLLEKAVPEDGPRGYPYTAPFLKFVDAFRTPEAVQNWTQNSLRPVLEMKPGNEFTLLDLGCGYGAHARKIAHLYPQSNVYGVDMDQKSIDRANSELNKEGLKNVQFVCTIGGQLPSDWTEKFDFVVINDVLHDAPGVDDLLAEVKRVLRSDGYAAAFDPPISSYHKNQANDKKSQLFLPFSLFSCLPMSLSGPTGEGHGVGWGYERRKETIEQHEFHVIKVGDSDINTIQERIVFQK
ncbi:uncharacterized protein LOC133176360 [Saccostrea echinata]|uniref:uncharacterized protein LOC133176360 n=1 Tax=Saccostrea echinata TaxID=191078 RepID=UPI002A80675D|nr:uncharacterized protein LOC133176360 [Saccostrea echinata]